MNASTLKLIGIIAMILDHIGWVIYPDIEWFHIVGKLAVPIFCYMIAEGYYKTHDVKRYLLRIVGLGVISQIPFLFTFRLCLGETFTGLTTIFDLALGLLCIWLYDKAQFKCKGIIIILGALLGLLAGIDGDYYIVILIFIFYKYHNRFGKMVLWTTVFTLFATVTIPAYGLIYALLNGATLGMLIQYVTTPEYISAVSPLLDQLLYLAALIPIYFYNGEKGRNIKVLFYGFYPLHLIILYILKVFVL